MTYTSPRRRVSHVLPEAPRIDLNQPGRLRTAHILALFAWSHSRLYEKIRAGVFPRPQKDGRSNYWTTEVVRERLRAANADDLQSAASPPCCGDPP